MHFLAGSSQLILAASHLPLPCSVTLSAGYRRTDIILFASSLIFGLVHWVEGPLGVMNTFAMGLILGAVYLRSGRNLWITIIAHGLANSIRFLFLFLGAA